MAFLTVAGVDVAVLTQGAKQLKPEKIGSSTRSFAGNLRVAQRKAARAWEVTVDGLTSAQIATLRTAAPDGSLQTVTGAMLYGESLTCQINYGEAAILEDSGSFYQNLVLNLVEANP